MISADLTTMELSEVVLIPVSCFKDESRPGSASLAVILSGERTPAFKIPRIKAEPILPAPITPNRRLSFAIANPPNSSVLRILRKAAVFKRFKQFHIATDIDLLTQLGLIETAKSKVGRKEITSQVDYDTIELRIAV
jgi:hypothetical protein